MPPTPRSLIPLATLTLLTPAALATPLYSPVVSRIGDPATPIEPLGGTPVDHQTTIQVYRPDLPNQPAPVAQQSYAPNTLQTYLSTLATGQLTNNPALADAAAKGLPYSGPNYVFSAGHTGLRIDPTSVVGYMTVTPSSVSNPTIAISNPGLDDALHAAVGDDTPANFWTASSSTLAANSNGYAYANTDTPLTSPADNARSIQIRQGQLFGSAVVTTGTLPPTNSFGVIQKIGTGTPTTGGNTATTLFRTGSLAAAAAGPLAFALLTDPARPTPSPDTPYNVAYVANTAAGANGIQRWTFDPATLPTNNGWSLSYTINDPNDLTGGFTGLAAQLDGTNVVLYATTSTTLGAGPLANSENRLEQFTDPLAPTGSPATTDATELTLATSPRQHPLPRRRPHHPRTRHRGHHSPPLHPRPHPPPPPASL